MIESIMYIGIGLLVGCLAAVAIVPLVQNHAIRLTVRRLEGRLPKSITEIRADKDLLRAEFAMSTRRLEITVEQLRNKMTNQLVELGKKSDIINRLNVERNQLKAEITAADQQISQQIGVRGDRRATRGSGPRRSDADRHWSRRHAMDDRLRLRGPVIGPSF